jgi:hypothetical protein
MLTLPISESAELTQWALYINYYSEVILPSESNRKSLMIIN